MTSSGPVPAPTHVAVLVADHGSRAALTFACAEADRAGAGLHLVAIVGLDAHEERGVARAEAVLSEAGAFVQSLAGGPRHVSSELWHGDPVPGIVHAVRGAHLLVLEREGRVERVAAPWVGVRITAHAPVAVAIVPGERSPVGGTVTVGVQDPLSCSPLVASGAAAARARGAALRIVHVGWDPTATDASDLSESVAALHLEPELTVSVETVLGRPAEVLLAASRRSVLMVVGRHHPKNLRGPSLGPVARRVLRGAACPVLLPTPADSMSSAEWVFAGHLG
ncbi:hypothetical protein BH11ACT8_BH11ACT8_07560 [soil metagenome]